MGGLGVFTLLSSLHPSEWKLGSDIRTSAHSTCCSCNLCNWVGHLRSSADNDRADCRPRFVLSIVHSPKIISVHHSHSRCWRWRRSISHNDCILGSGTAPRPRNISGNYGDVSCLPSRRFIDSYLDLGYGPLVLQPVLSSQEVCHRSYPGDGFSVRISCLF
jgi:hypothetical protein